MNKEELLKAHEQNRDNTEYTEELVDILGGIDNIIHLILSSNDIDIENDKILQIHQTITQKECTQALIQQQRNDEPSDPSEFTFYFKTNNDFLHALFGNTKGNKILNVLLSKYTAISMLIMVVVWWALWSYLRDGYMFYIYSCLQEFIVIVYIILQLLSVNQKSFHLIIRRFVFWFKMYNSLTLMFWACIYRYHVEKQNDKIEAFAVKITSFVMVGVIVCLTIIAVSLVDGFNARLCLKILFTSSMAVLMSLSAINYTFYSYINGEDNSIIKVNFIGPTIYISCYSMIGNSLSVLAIFISKNTINLIRKRDKCILIKLPAPYLKWIDDANVSKQDDVETAHELDQLSPISYDVRIDDLQLDKIIDAKDCNNNDQQSDEIDLEEP